MLSTRLPDRHDFGLRQARHHRPDVIADPLVRLPDRVVGKVRVALRRRDLGVAKELPDLLEWEP